MDIEMIDNLICVFKNYSSFDNIVKGSCAYLDMQEKLEKQLEKQLQEVHKNKIFKTSDGRYKTHNPQIIKKTRIELLISLFEYYFHHSPLEKRRIPTIKTLYPKWLETYMILIEQGHRSIGSIRHYKSDYTKFLKGTSLESKDIRKITFQEIKQFYASITAGQEITRKVLNNVKTLINQIFDFARDQNIPVINTHDIRTVDLACKETDNSEKVYSDDERSKIIDTCLKNNNVYSRCIGLMFCLCVRIGEIKALKWSDVDFENKRVYIHRSMVQVSENGVYADKCVDRTKGKKKKCNRYENLSDLGIYFLKEQRKETGFCEYVFMSNNHPLLTNMINKKLKIICEMSGVEYLSSHKIRFWAVTAMYNANIPTSNIQYTAGHTNPATTEHYKRLAKSQPSINSDIWSDLFG